MLLQDIKKIEYRIKPDGTEVVDFLYTDNTKTKVPYAELAEKLTLVDSEIDALRRTRRIIVKTIELIDANRAKGEGEQILDPKLIP